MPIDPDALERTLTRLRADDHATSPVEVVLQRVIETTQHVFDVTGAGLMFVDDGEVMRYVASSDEPGRVLEVAQEEFGVGPCVDALVHGVVVRVTDIATDLRYQVIAPIVVEHGVRGVLGLPVRVSGSTVGSLNVYSAEPNEWDDDDIRALQAFNDLIETIVAAAMLSEQQGEVIRQLEYALENRVVIERAVGVIMAQEDLDAVSAFNRLRAESRGRRRRVHEVAQELLAELGPA